MTMNAKLLTGSMIIAAVGVSSGGCSATPPARTVDTINPAAPAAVSTTTSDILVDDAIARACNLPTPHFAFDSSTVREVADARLDKIAQCFTTGALAGRRMNLVGRADPRGETEYNFALGQRRAGSVASYIEHHGVRVDQVATTSRGELDATGTNAEGWAKDRRVDMNLAN
jgi:peptidoglycan-associated lipoprotein